MSFATINGNQTQNAIFTESIAPTVRPKEKNDCKTILFVLKKQLQEALQTQKKRASKITKFFKLSVTA